MRDPKKEALRHARHWLRKCAALGVNVYGVNAKENKKGKETFPPAPPIEKRGEQEKDDDPMATPYMSNVPFDRCGDAGLKAIFPVGAKARKAFVAVQPEQHVYLAWCREAGIDNEEWALDRFNRARVTGWMDDDGNIITNWPLYFLASWKNHFKAKTPKRTRQSVKGAYLALPPDYRRMFDGFWNEYPNRRRIEKDKCASVFHRILSESGDAVGKFNEIMEGLGKWKESWDWRKQEGEYVMMPYRFLFRENWLVTPERGSGVERRQQVSATANVQLGEKLW